MRARKAVVVREAWESQLCHLRRPLCAIVDPKLIKEITSASIRFQRVGCIDLLSHQMDATLPISTSLDFSPSLNHRERRGKWPSTRSQVPGFCRGTPQRSSTALEWTAELGVPAGLCAQIQTIENADQTADRTARLSLWEEAEAGNNRRAFTSRCEVSFGSKPSWSSKGRPPREEKKSRRRDTLSPQRAFLDCHRDTSSCASAAHRAVQRRDVGAKRRS